MRRPAARRIPSSLSRFYLRSTANTASTSSGKRLQTGVVPAHGQERYPTPGPLTNGNGLTPSRRKVPALSPTSRRARRSRDTIGLLRRLTGAKEINDDHRHVRAAFLQPHRLTTHTGFARIVHGDTRINTMRPLDSSSPRAPNALDTGDWRPMHTKMLVALGLGWMLDAFEVTLVGNVLPILRRVWSLGTIESTMTISLWLVGILIGAVVFGWAADQFGRRRLFIVTLLLYATATFIGAFSVNFAMFLVLRVIAAIGVGAEYSAVNAAVAELMPARWRGRAAALVMSFWPLGALAGGALTLGVLAVAPPTAAWRIVFAGGALIAFFVLWVRRVLPESPRWLMTHGRVAEAEGAVALIAGERAAACWRTQGLQPSTFHYGLSALGRLCRQYPGRLALGATLDISEAAGYYGLFALIPLAIVPALHLPFAGTPLFYLVGSAGALCGALVAAWLIERTGRKRTVTGFYVTAALAMVGMGAALDIGSVATLAAFVLVSAVTTGSWVAAYPAFAEIFPTRARATGIGASVAAGRVAAGLAPPLLVFIAARFSITAALGVAALFYLVGVGAMLPWIAHGPEAKGVTLEELAGLD